MKFNTNTYNKYRYLVYKLAWKYTNTHTPFEDLVQEGMEGLRKACERFNGQNEFSTYAYITIHGQIRQYIAYNNSIVHVPVEKKKLCKITYTEIPEIPYEKDENLTNDLEIALSLIRNDIAELIRMSYFDGLTKREIAFLTGLSYDSIVYRIEKGLKDMREYL